MSEDSSAGSFPYAIMGTPHRPIIEATANGQHCQLALVSDGRSSAIPERESSASVDGSGIVDLIGKGRRLRTVPVPAWSKQLLDEWLSHSGVSEGRVFRRVSKAGKRQETGVTANVVWYAVKRCARKAGILHLSPHDLRRTCARLCHDCSGELEQIRFPLGHASVQTTERYIGSKQKLQDAVNDRFEISVASDTA